MCRNADRRRSTEPAVQLLCRSSCRRRPSQTRPDSEGLFSIRIEEEQRRVLYNEPAAQQLHDALARLLTEIVGSPLVPTYVFTARDEGGAYLHEHVDRA